MDPHLGISTAGTRLTWCVLTCHPASEDGRWWTPHPRRPVMVGQMDRKKDKIEGWM